MAKDSVSGLAKEEGGLRIMNVATRSVEVLTKELR